MASEDRTQEIADEVDKLSVASPWVTRLDTGERLMPELATKLREEWPKLSEGLRFSTFFNVAFRVGSGFVISLKRGLAGYIVPSKLYGILAAGRPFVASVEEDTEGATVAKRFTCGLLAQPVILQTWRKTFSSYTQTTI